MARKPKHKTTPQVSDELSGFDIRINEFGEIISNIKVNELNEFLDQRVEDKKFKGIDVVKRDDQSFEINKAQVINGLDND